MVFADNTDADRQFGIEFPGIFSLSLKKFELNAAAQTRLLNVYQQIGNFRLVGKLA